MYKLRLTMFFVGLGGLAMSTPLWARPIDAPLTPSEAPGASNDTGASQGSDTEVKSDAVAEADTVSKSDAVQTAADSNSISLSLLVSSVYNFRGLNVFKETSQGDQNSLFSPSVTAPIFHPSLWLSYAGFFQIDGDNRGYLVDSGVGAEQDVAVGFDYDISNKWVLSTSLVYYFYPFSISHITGIKWPSYLEPTVGFNYTFDKSFKVGLQLSYFTPIQKRLRDQRYMYTRLIAVKEIPFHSKLSLDFNLSAGYKLFADPSILQDTIFDVEFCASLPYTIANNLKLVPTTHAAWAYLVGTNFGEQYMIYFSLSLVADF